jgi:hypothetical protein
MSALIQSGMAETDSHPAVEIHVDPRALRVIGELLTWDNGVSSIHLEEYGEDLDSSSLVFALDDYLKQKRPRCMETRHATF